MDWIEPRMAVPGVPGYLIGVAFFMLRHYPDRALASRVAVCLEKGMSIGLVVRLEGIATCLDRKISDERGGEN